MRTEPSNPYASDAQNESGVPERTPLRRAVRTLLTTVALMCAVVVAMSAILFIESVIKRQPIEAFWAELADESWIPLLFVGTIPVLAGGKSDCCCISRLLRRKSARAANGGDPGATPTADA